MLFFYKKKKKWDGGGGVGGGGGVVCRSYIPKRSEIKKKKNFVDTMISNVLRD